ncbi:DUF5675 family protein [Flavihumibacter profundi]|uniref:DUF5675 family protein n=1 Tax=Flavihumibacter profundi TaxID=2716883 RepID=UPI001CC61D0B|nr:DUF5675 family protein [Flavihumibacter profundi]MBZ5858370.1 DUF5675 family protein [Flavihumibacter profundi]
MELLLQRTYYETGTNGILRILDDILCYTIELPWRNNAPMKSCIPKGRYPVVLRYSPRHKNHLLLKDTGIRKLILIHRANNARTELKGCIATVTELTGPGMGKGSGKAFNKLLDLVFIALKDNKPVWITLEEMPAIINL